MIRSFLVGAVVGLLSSFTACGGSTTKACSPATCTSGCCDASGACQVGSSTQACGNSGFLCTVCGVGQVCTFGTCITQGSAGGGSGGGSGGGTGGGTGGGSGGGFGGGSGGGSASCRVVSSFPAAGTYGQYAPSSFVIGQAQNSLNAPFDVVMGGAVMFRGGTVPGTGDLSTPTNWDLNTAQYVSAYGKNCSGGASSITCTTSFIAVSGFVTVGAPSGTSSSGSVSVTLQNVRYQEQLDGGLPNFNGRCIELPSASYTSSWP